MLGLLWRLGVEIYIAERNQKVVENYGAKNHQFSKKKTFSIKQR